MRVLLVENDPVLCRASRRVLTANGHEPACVHSLAEVRMAVHEFKPDIVITDLILPDSKNPHTTAEAVTSMVDKDRVPVVAMHNAELEAEVCIDMGVTAVIVKGGYSALELPSTLTRAFGRLKLIVALKNRANGTLPSKVVEPQKVGDRMLLLAKELRAVANG